jgi:hypothetical protein
VARRIIDSVEPGYFQIGVNWLPLIHLVYLPIIAFKSQYQSGFLPSLISVAAFSISCWLAYRIACRATGSTAAGIFAGGILLANSNLQYLQSCPLTETVYMALFLLAIDSLMSWRQSNYSGYPWIPAMWAGLGALCRYEGWFLIAGVLLLFLFDVWIKFLTLRAALRKLVVYLAVAGLPVAAHFGYVLMSLGDSFLHRVAGGYPAPYVTYKSPLLSVIYHLSQLSQMATTLPLVVAAVGLLYCIAGRERLQRLAPLLLLWMPSLINIAALYWGLIYRLRYSVLLLPAIAVFGSLAVGFAKLSDRTMVLAAVVAVLMPWLPWYIPNKEFFKPGPGLCLIPAAALILFLIARAKEWTAGTLLVLCIIGMQIPLLARETRPMIVETMEHEFIEPERQEVLQYLQHNYDGKRILIDMGKLAPLVYDSKLPVKDFIYNEGKGAYWHKALRDPEQQVGWICSEMGDAIHIHLQDNPDWAAGYLPVVKTKSMTLYRLKR